MPIDHHPDCEFIPWSILFEDLPFDLEEKGIDPEWAKQAGVMNCHKDCPSLACAIERGKELAEKYDW